MAQVSLDKLLQRPDIWQSARPRRADTGVATGFARLDTCLHLGGWPRGSLIEILCKKQGIGELQLLLPTLARLTAAGHHCLLLSPPYTPYPPALEATGTDIGKLLVIESRDPLERLWCAEQALRSRAAGCVIGWFGSQKLQTTHLRKLLLAAGQTDTLFFLHRDETMARHASPASLRLRLDSSRSKQLELEILKQPGGWSGQTTSLTRPESWLNTSLWHLPLALQPRGQQLSPAVDPELRAIHPPQPPHHHAARQSQQ